MKQAKINQDAFLQRQGIEVEGSQFLRRSLMLKEEGIKEEYNLRDIHGRRLSRFWQPGDTIWSVIRKRIFKRVEVVLDPDTYTEQTIKNVRQTMLREKIMILGCLIFMMIPFTAYNNFIKPRINRVKRLYLMQFYNKMSFFSRELGLKTKPISQKDLQDTL